MNNQFMGGGMPSQNTAPVVSGREVQMGGGGGSPSGGPQISGEWTHKITGKKIFVRDSIMDGDNMILITNEGQLGMEEFSTYYIQTDDSGFEGISQPVQGTEIRTTTTTVMPAFDPATQGLGTKPDVTATVSKQSKHASVIEPVIKDNMPQINTFIQWDNCPKDGLIALFKYFNIDEDDVVDFIFNKITIDKDNLKENLHRFLQDIQDK